MGEWVLDFARLRLSQPSLVKLKLGLSLAKIELFYFFLFFIDGSEKTRLSSIVSQPKKVIVQLGPHLKIRLWTKDEH